MGLKRRIRVEPEFSLAAMIDVIFLLLMFFMLTSKFVTPNALNLTLPSSSATTMASPNLSVSITRDGKLYVEHTLMMDGQHLKTSIEAKIKALHLTPKEATITVVAESGASIDDVVKVLDIANQLQVKTILATDNRPAEK
jgi:biopolymer transport protein ExbD